MVDFNEGGREGLLSAKHFSTTIEGNHIGLLGTFFLRRVKVIF
jgi:hypothetical protein